MNNKKIDYARVVYNQKSIPLTSYPKKLVKHLIRKFNLKPREIFLEEFFEDGEEVEFILKNKDEFKVKLKKKIKYFGFVL